MFRSFAVFLLMGLWGSILACESSTFNQDQSQTERLSNDPGDYEVDSSVVYEVQLSEARWIIPSKDLPEEISVMASNNNVDIAYFQGRLFVAWRTAPTHFASEETLMYVMSSEDEGKSWDFELKVEMGTDMREPRLLSFSGALKLLFFEAGIDPLRFEPQTVWSVKREGLNDWTQPEVLMDAPEVPWDVKVRGGVAYMTSYLGEHYGGDEDGGIDLYFKFSTDGDRWNKVDGREFVYRGGVSEAAFEFDSRGDLWAITRNEDGDSSGKGAHICTAPADDLGSWTCSNPCLPDRYDSPELFRHGDEIYLVARRDVGGTYGDDPNMLAYSTRPKRTALYRLSREQRAIDHILDLPSAGDTSFPAIWRTGPHRFLLANYSSPLDDLEISWMEGQLSPKGTQIYLIDLEFVPRDRTRLE